MTLLIGGAEPSGFALPFFMSANLHAEHSSGTVSGYQREESRFSQNNCLVRVVTSNLRVRAANLPIGPELGHTLVLSRSLVSEYHLVFLGGFYVRWNQ